LAIGDNKLEKVQRPEHQSNESGKPITNVEDNAKHEREQARLTMKAFRLTSDKSNQFTIDQGDGKEVTDRRPIKNAEQPNESAGETVKRVQNSDIPPISATQVVGSRSDFLPVELRSPTQPQSSERQTEMPLSSPGSAEKLDAFLESLKRQIIGPKFSNTDSIGQSKIDDQLRGHPESLRRDGTDGEEWQSRDLRHRSEKQWQETLEKYNHGLELRLGHKPTHDDYAFEAMHAKSKEEALTAALLFAYTTFPRRESESAFAHKYAEKMLHRADVHNIKPLNPEHLDPNKIQQNFPDSCVLISSIIAMARTPHGRKALCDMVHLNKDGSYEVKFHDPKNSDRYVSVHVPKLTAAEKMLGSSCEESLLVTIIEKAYGHYLNSNDQSKVFSVQSEACKLGLHDPATAVELLTGIKYEERPILHGKIDKLDPTEQMLQNYVKEAKENGHIILAGVDRFNIRAVQKFGLHTEHAYEIQGIDPKTHQIILRDPIDREHRTIKMSLNDFLKTFNSLILKKDLKSKK
jgi:hypothetical protein